MVYISEGNLMDKRTWFRLSIISDFFWGILNFIVFFFQTLTSPMGIEKDKKKMGRIGSSGSGTSGGAPPRPPPGFKRQMGRVDTSSCNTGS